MPISLEATRSSYLPARPLEESGQPLEVPGSCPPPSPQHLIPSSRGLCPPPLPFPPAQPPCRPQALHGQNCLQGKRGIWDPDVSLQPVPWALSRRRFRGGGGRWRCSPGTAARQGFHFSFGADLEWPSPLHWAPGVDSPGVKEARQVRCCKEIAREGSADVRGNAGKGGGLWKENAGGGGAGEQGGRQAAQVRRPAR